MHRNRIKYAMALWVVIVLIAVLFISLKEGITETTDLEKPADKVDSLISKQKETTADVAKDEPEIAHKIIDENGTTLSTRFNTPIGYTREAAENGSFTEFLRNYELKEDGAEVLKYDGSPKGNQSAHAAVFALPIEEYDLQQCADSIIRMYAEYYYKTGQAEKIKFHYVCGFLAEYTKWREGYRISVDSNDNVEWTDKQAEYDDSYENLVAYLKNIFTYAGTLSMEDEAYPIELSELQTGDVFLRGASPGHAVMVVDICRDSEGKIAFLLAQGYMPAQEFHVLKNPLHEDDPWYYEDEVTYPFRTPEYTFEEGTLKRLTY